MAVYITNKTVAWQVPPGRIERLFQRGAYLPPVGWGVTAHPDAGVVCMKNCRKIRKADVEQANFISQEIPVSTRGRAVAARQDHNLEVGGLTPPPATKEENRRTSTCA